MDQIKVTGIVLSEFLLGENDKRLTILTKEKGRLQVIARRARRQNTKVFPLAQPFVYGEFLLSIGRNYIYLDGGECRDSFGDIKFDWDGVRYCSYFAEVAEYVTMEYQDERNILNLLYVSFLALRKKLIPYSLIKSIFEYKILQYNGVGIQVFSCLNCESEEDLNMLSFSHGGVYCRKCAAQMEGTAIDAAVLYTMQYIASVSLSSLYSFTLKEDISAEFTWIVRRFFNIYMDHTFKSARMLDIN